MRLPRVNPASGRQSCLTRLFLFVLLAAACSSEGPGVARTVAYAPGWEPRLAESLPNRSRWPEVTASSARLGLMPLHGQSVMDLLPITWPLLLPHFAVDGSGLTRWASDTHGCPFLVLEPVRPTEEPVQVSSLLLEWSDEVPKTFVLEASLDGQNWRTVLQGSPIPNGEQALRFQTPVVCRQLRLRSRACPLPQGMSLLEISVVPAADPRLPPPVTRMLVEHAGARSAEISWDPVPLAYLYRVHRLSAPLEPPAEENLAGITRETRYQDSGLRPDSRCFYRVLPETFSGSVGGSVTHLSVATSPAGDNPLFPFRGVVEGFYNQPWSFPDREEMLRFLGAADLNFYLYAPKTDAFHRGRWREPYPVRELSLFRDLIRQARLHGVTFCYGLSPGMDFDWDDPREPERILEKLRVFHDLGVRAFCLLFDDTPDTLQSDRELARKHTGLVSLVLERINSWPHGPASLFFVPTIYFKTLSELERLNPRYVEYLEGLSQMPVEVPIFWVGPGMPFSAAITREQAEEISRILARRIVIWDNYPTTDNFLLYEPFCGPYRNRDPQLHLAVQGILSNPMNYPNLSRIPLLTLARYLDEPASYRPEEAFEEAVAAVGGPRAGPALRDFALQFYGHPIIPPTNLESPEFAALLQGFWQEYAGAGYPGSQAAGLESQLLRFSALPESLENAIADPRLRAELREPAQKIGLYGEAGLVCLEILRLLHQGRNDEVKPLLDQLAGLLAQARSLPWRPGENYLHWLAAVLFESPPVQVDVIRGFLRRVRAMAEEAVAGTE